MAQIYKAEAPTPQEIAETKGPLLLQFGTNWCGFCQAAAPIVEEATKELSEEQHIMVEDGPGRRLGRSFKVKLWPTLIFLKDGIEQQRTVRPASVEEIRNGLKSIS